MAENKGSKVKVTSQNPILQAKFCGSPSDQIHGTAGPGLSLERSICDRKKPEGISKRVTPGWLRKKRKKKEEKQGKKIKKTKKQKKTKTKNKTSNNNKKTWMIGWFGASLSAWVMRELISCCLFQIQLPKNQRETFWYQIALGIILQRLFQMPPNQRGENLFQSLLGSQPRTR